MKPFATLIRPVAGHTNHVGPGSIFVAYQGQTNDGINFIPAALAKGATTIILSTQHIKAILPTCTCTKPEFYWTDTTKALCIRCQTTWQYVDSPRKTMALLSARAHDNPAQKLKFIGITGTKGKTTTAHLIAHLLNHAGQKTALLGSVYNQIGSTQQVSKLTTPDSSYLHSFFAQAVDHNIKYVVLEASSHAIDQHRLHGLSFEALCFTNLAQDHLDYHHSMSEYFATKAKLFDQLAPDGAAIINTDDAWGNKLASMVQDPTTLGTQNQQNTINVLQNSLINGISFTLSNNQTFHAPYLAGQFNVFNAAQAILTCRSLGLDDETIEQGLKTFWGVPGRMQLYKLPNGAIALIDFAHNPSSMHAVLSFLRTQTTHLVVVFGAGGGRDRKKRPLMGQVAQQFADKIILTTDNPRNEDPQKITAEIAKGITKAMHFEVLLNRSSAIEHAIKNAENGDVVAILGKGSETVMKQSGKDTPFDDRTALNASSLKVFNESIDLTSQMETPDINFSR